MLIKNDCEKMSLKIFNLILSGEAFRLFFYIFPEKEIKEEDFGDIADLCFGASFPDATQEHLIKKLEASLGEMEKVRLINVKRNSQGEREEIIINPESEWIRKNEIDPINLNFDVF